MKTHWFQALITIFLLTSAYTCFAVDVCSKNNFLQLIESAQTVATDTPTKAAAFISCSSGDLKEAAAQWLYLYNILVKAPITGGPLHDLLVSPKSPSSEFEADIQSARRGDFHVLFQKIDLADYQYVRSKQAHLALARSLARATQYDEAGKYYESYLKLADGDEYVEVEYLFMHIIANNYESAGIYAHKLESYRETPFILASVQNARVILDKVTQTEGSRISSFEPNGTSSSLVASIKEYQHTDYLKRDTFGFHYHGPLDILINQHRIKYLLYDETARATEVHALYHDGYTQWFTYAIDLGYFSAAPHDIIGNSTVTLHYPSDIATSLSLTKEPMALRDLLTTADSDFIESEYALAVRYKQLVFLKGSIHEETQGSAWEKHTATLLQNVSLPDLSTLALRIKLVADIEKHPKPSVNYQAFPQSIILSGGFESSYKLHQNLNLGMNVLYGIGRNNTYEKPDTLYNNDEIDADVRIQQRLDQLIWEIAGGMKLKTYENQLFKTDRQTALSLSGGYIF